MPLRHCRPTDLNKIVVFDYVITKSSMFPRQCVADETCYLYYLYLSVHHILTTNLAACVCVFVCAQHFTNFSPHALISSLNVPKILFA